MIAHLSPHKCLACTWTRAPGWLCPPRSATANCHLVVCVWVRGAVHPDHAIIMLLTHDPTTCININMHRPAHCHLHALLSPRHSDARPRRALSFHAQRRKQNSRKANLERRVLEASSCVPMPNRPIARPVVCSPYGSACRICRQCRMVVQWGGQQCEGKSCTTRHRKNREPTTEQSVIRFRTVSRVRD